jgi:hypothetical protein
VRNNPRLRLTIAVVTGAFLSGAYAYLVWVGRVQRFETYSLVIVVEAAVIVLLSVGLHWRVCSRVSDAASSKVVVLLWRLSGIVGAIVFVAARLLPNETPQGGLWVGAIAISLFLLGGVCLAILSLIVQLRRYVNSQKHV